MKYVCEHCFTAHISEQWNKATRDVFEDIKLIEKCKGKQYLERGFLYMCPSCNMTNNSQFIEKVG